MNKSFNTLKREVLSWLDSMRTGDFDYRMHATSDANIFNSCFAIFILDLFGELKKLPDDRKAAWAGWLQSFQDSRTGLFFPDQLDSTQAERLSRQLTAFCLSALHLLDSKPLYPLTFMEQYQSPEEIELYLEKAEVHRGISDSGIKAMFLGIFLTWLYEQENSQRHLDNLEFWFRWHEQHQNPDSGFWGRSLESYYYEGLHNAYHQFVIYNYWHRPIPQFKRIVDTTLLLQDRHGYFASTPGGDSCRDYHAVDILCNACRNTDYRRYDMERALEKALAAILRVQNDDGGFCNSKQIPKLKREIPKYLPFFIHHGVPYLWYLRLRKTTGIFLRDRQVIFNGWNRSGSEWDQSNLWDTWFRCLTIAEIARTLNRDHPLDSGGWHFHRFVGLGFFRQDPVKIVEIRDERAKVFK